MNTLESIVAVEKAAQDEIVRAGQQAQDLQVQTEQQCQELLREWTAQEKTLDAELKTALDKKRDAAAKKAREKDAEALTALAAQVKRNGPRTKKLFLDLLE